MFWLFFINKMWCVTTMKNTHMIADLKRTTSMIDLRKDNALCITFGCKKCDWIGTINCPHDIQPGSHHLKWYCIERMKYIKELFNAVGSLPRAVQIDEIAKTIMELNKMRTEAELPPHFHQLQRNLIKLLGDVRKQDEGIKIQGEITHFHEEIIDTVKAHAKVIKDAEEQDNAGRRSEVQGKV